MMTDKEYDNIVAALFAIIEQLVDETDADSDSDGHVIEIVNQQDEKIIINKQAPKQEVWLASKKEGRHFAFVDGEWRDTRDSSLLLERLRQLL